MPTEPHASAWWKRRESGCRAERMTRSSALGGSEGMSRCKAPAVTVVLPREGRRVAGRSLATVFGPGVRVASAARSRARRRWCARLQDGKPKRATDGRDAATHLERTGLFGWSKASRSSQRAAGERRGGTARGDVGSAVRGGECSEGQGIGEEAPYAHVPPDAVRQGPKPGEPHGRERDATSPQVGCGGSRRGGEKPRGRNMGDAWQRHPEAERASAEREWTHAIGATERRSLKNPVGGARLRAGRLRDVSPNAEHGRIRRAPTLSRGGARPESCRHDPTVRTARSRKHPVKAHELGGTRGEVVIDFYDPRHPTDGTFGGMDNGISIPTSSSRRS